MASSFELDCNVEETDFKNIAMGLAIYLLSHKEDILPEMPYLFFMNSKIIQKLKIKICRKTVKQFVNNA